MKIVFYKRELSWPRSSGHDVHTYNMMLGLARQGARVSLATRGAASPEAVAGLQLEHLATLNSACRGGKVPLGLNWAENRFRSYWGIEIDELGAFRQLASDLRPDVVVAVGLDALPLLGAVSDATRVWYAADEWVWHHLSQLTLLDRRTWPELSAALVKGLYERVYRRRIDRAWVVSRPDARAMRWIAGVRHVDILPNGVDGEFYSPGLSPVSAGDTAVFWGRLDFGPNIQALEWFCNDVWPVVSRARPSASFTIIGFKPTARVERLAAGPRIELLRDAPDIRPLVAQRSVVVLPFVSGGGIKNKLLEAAAMGKPIVCTSRARTGLKGSPPLRVADSPDEWARTLLDLWGNESLRAALSEQARSWVLREHSWESTARDAFRALRSEGE